jgi:hypothetical protein
VRRTKRTAGECHPQCSHSPNVSAQSSTETANQLYRNVANKNSAYTDEQGCDAVGRKLSSTNDFRYAKSNILSTAL